MSPRRSSPLVMIWFGSNVSSVSFSPTQAYSVRTLLATKKGRKKRAQKLGKTKCLNHYILYSICIYSLYIDESNVLRVFVCVCGKFEKGESAPWGLKIRKKKYAKNMES